MDKSILIQQQIRNNTEDIQKELLDLKAWEQEMKRKDVEIKSSADQTLPPIRSKKSKKLETKKNNQSSLVTQRIKSYDYSSWDKYDVDKACSEIDADDQAKEVEEELTPEQLEKMHTEATELKVKGNEHVKKQEWQKAIDCYTKAIQIFSYDATFFANRALCCLKLNNLYSAEADCTVAIQLDETYVKAYHRRAQARLELKQYKEAKQDIEKLLELEPSNKEGQSMLIRVNQTISNHKQTIPLEESKSSCIAIEKKIGEKLMREPQISEDKKVKEKPISSSNVKDKQGKKKVNLPSWVGNLEKDFEIIEPVTKQPHQRLQKSMKQVPVREVNLGVSVLSKSIEQLEAESQRQKSENLKAADEFEGLKEETQKNNRLLIQVLGEELDKDPEILPVPKTSMQFISNWNKTKSPSFRYKYLEQISPESFPTLFKDFLEFDTLHEILHILGTEFINRKKPVYQYLENLSQVKRFRAVTLFLSAEDKKIVQQLLEYTKSVENKSKQEIEKLREKYEV